MIARICDGVADARLKLARPTALKGKTMRNNPMDCVFEIADLRAEDRKRLRRRKQPGALSAIRHRGG